MVVFRAEAHALAAHVQFCDAYMCCCKFHKPRAFTEHQQQIWSVLIKTLAPRGHFALVFYGSGHDFAAVALTIPDHSFGLWGGFQRSSALALTAFLIIDQEAFSARVLWESPSGAFQRSSARKPSCAYLLWSALVSALICCGSDHDFGTLETFRARLV